MKINEIENLEKEYFDESGYASSGDEAYEVIANAMIAVSNVTGEFGEHFFSLNIAERAILLLEAVNLMAKRIDSKYYVLKVDLAWAIMVVKSDFTSVRVWQDGELFYFYSRNVGVVSIHDPFGQVSFFASEFSLDEEFSIFNWSGVYRQSSAWENLKDRAKLEFYQEATRPRVLTSAFC